MNRVMLVWHSNVEISISHQGIFVKVSYVTGLFLANCGYVCRKGKVENWLWTLKMQSSRAWAYFAFSASRVILATPLILAFRLLLSLSQLLQAFFFNCSPSRVLLQPFSVLLQASSSCWCVLSSSAWLVIFCCCLEWLLKVGFLCGFSLKRKCFWWLKCSSCIISVCCLGFWSKGWSFVENGRPLYGFTV